MKIFPKLFKMFLFVIIAPLLITIVFLFQYQKHAKKELLQNYLNTVEIFSFSLENYALNLSRDINALLINQPLQEQKNILKNQVLQDTNILFVAIFSPKGQELTRAKNINFENLPLLDLSNNDDLKNIPEGEIKINYPEDIFSPYTTITLKQKNGNILLIVTDITDLIKQTELHKIGKSGGLYFLDKDGYHILSKDTLPIISLSEYSLDLKGTISNFKTKTGLTLAGAYTKNPIGEGYLFLLQNQKEAFFTINLISWLIIFFGLATTTLSYFASMYFAEDFAEPIEKLIEAANEITKNNFSVYIDEKKYMEEFDTLIKTFNSMAMKLKEYQAVQLDKLIEETNKVNLLARLMRDGIIMCTLEGEELFSNKTAKHILTSEAFAENIEKTTHLKNLEDNSLKYLLKVPSGTIFEYMRNGRNAYFEVVTETFRLQSQESIAIILFRDITSEHEISEMKNDVFNAVAHDLRAPILGIQGYIMLLEEQNLSREEQNQMLKAISNSSKMLVSLVENILDISKLERGLLVLNKIKFDLEKSAQDIVYALTPLAKQKNLDLKITSDKDLIISADKNLIERVFTNLISNAIKFTSKGNVSLDIKQENQNYKITIKDTGVGIPKEELPKIFNKYHQADRNVRGYGLGLTIVKQIIEAHQGRIEVASEINKGTEFYITLPINPEQERLA
ncbi:MAG: GHKL domain-containing protein [Elusimicrobiaceae bacterium]|nr:GHKL domain-containing protein [Elusimicrobiaceae bacterium]